MASQHVPQLKTGTTRVRQARPAEPTIATMSSSGAETFLRIVLRWEGSVSLLALAAVVMPHSSMDAIHRWLGMGPLPPEPIVGYLARSVSAFYALFGALLWMLSFDLQRHRPTLRFLGLATIALGAMLVGIDWVEGLPRFWRIGEGPFVMLIGGAIAWPAYRMKPPPDEQ
jgi:hypothetical protein